MKKKICICKLVCNHTFPLQNAILLFFNMIHVTEQWIFILCTDNDIRFIHMDFLRCDIFLWSDYFKIIPPYIIIEHSLLHVFIYISFLSTKRRVPRINRSLEEKTFKYLGDIFSYHEEILAVPTHQPSPPPLSLTHEGKL